jgi:hypothetical protein
MDRLTPGPSGGMRPCRPAPPPAAPGSRACSAPWRAGSAGGNGSRRRVQGRGRVAGQPHHGDLLCRIGRRGRGAQRLGIGVQRVRRAALSAGAVLDDPAQIHDRDALAEIADDAQVVGDEDGGEVALLACSRFSSTSTWAWTETSSAETGSSRNSNSGPTESARAMPMRWRWPPENSCGYLCTASAGKPDLGQQCAHPLRPFLGVADAVDLHRLGQRIADAPARVQRGSKGPGTRSAAAGAGGAGPVRSP